MLDLYTNLHLLARWLHVIAGITWIGFLYFFNFVNGPLQAALDDSTKKALNPQLLPRTLWWFRWGAMVTLLSGLILFVMNYFYTGEGFGATELLIDPFTDRMTARAMWILFGMTLGIIMWFNVWFIIWPAQKSLLSGAVAADKVPSVRKRAAFFSKVNTYLSGPMLFGMLAPSHYGAISVPIFFLAVALGLLAIWAGYRSAPKVGKP